MTSYLARGQGIANSRAHCASPEAKMANSKVNGPSVSSSRTNLPANTLVDLASIEAWVGHHAQATGVTATKMRSQKKRFGWSLATTPPCEIIYMSDRPYTVEIRIVSTKKGHLIEAFPEKLQRTCATTAASLLRTVAPRRFSGCRPRPCRNGAWLCTSRHGRFPKSSSSQLSPSSPRRWTVSRRLFPSITLSFEASSR